MSIRRKPVLFAGALSLAMPLAACGILGIDFDNARPYADAGATGEGASPFGGDGDGGSLVTGACARPMPCGEAGCPSSGGHVLAISATSYTPTCAMLDDRSIKCWTDSIPPVKVAGPEENIVRLLPGRGGMAIDAQGSLRVFGINFHDGGTFASSFPWSSPVVDVAYGQRHACALTTSCGVQCRGQNAHGQLGNGTKLTSVHPVDVKGLSSGVVQITAGDDHSCALLTDGTAKCWGSNDQDQRGVDSKVDSEVPEDVTTAVSMQAAGTSTCFLHSTGSLYCTGALEKSYYEDTPEPVVDFAVGSSHACLVTVSGGAKCWGSYLSGRLSGRPSDALGCPPADYNGWVPSKPCDVVGLSSGVAQVAVGDSFSCARMTDGRVLCWGSKYGASPVPIEGL